MVRANFILLITLLFCILNQSDDSETNARSFMNESMNLFSGGLQLKDTDDLQ